MGFPNKETQFKPGQSGNPNGRPKGTVDVMTRVQRLLEEEKDLPAALKKTIRARCGGDKRAIDAIFISLLLEALQGDARAAKELLDRGYGKVPDKIEGGDPDNPIPLTSKLIVELVRPKGSQDG